MEELVDVADSGEPFVHGDENLGVLDGVTAECLRNEGFEDLQGFGGTVFGVFGFDELEVFLFL